MDRRREFTPEVKVQVVLDLLSGAKSVAAVCREHERTPLVVSAWREEFVRRAPEIFARGQHQSPEQQRIADLERLVGRQALGTEVPRKASSIWGAPRCRNGSSA